MLNFVYSGHQSFALRISWLPKAVAAIENQIDPFGNPREGMKHLGLGKNMVEALEFWVKATGVAQKTKAQWTLSDFASKVLSRQEGLDPFLENQQTLWLLHWFLCSGWDDGETTIRPYAWHFLTNVFPDDEMVATEVVDHFAGAVSTQPKSLSTVTLRQHFDVFIRTYVAGESDASKGTPEDTLDSPLATLNLIKRYGEKKLPNGKRETIFRIDCGPKPSFSTGAFRFCLQSWWSRSHPNEKQLTLRDISFSEDSPGRVFRLPETDIYSRLVALTQSYPHEWRLVESQNQRGIERLEETNADLLLKSIYERK
ncbi:hypothetical protein CWO84_23825 [Methylomonas sp. Kb3]|uniref:DUF4007 family protein n=1 Tax=Methylomonas sp. Kb3 TaxID=1611544 RepID=UPI000C332267|nr:DUF4007 family protein [Methylomonas sp. Kb3]PKD38241.1 hypothetical protein CWO84_23825 [Methylomonas sp. Kb3]